MEVRKRIGIVLVTLVAFTASAWEDEHAPSFKMDSAEVKTLSGRSVTNFVKKVVREDFAHIFMDEGADASIDFYLDCSEGWSLDLNGDGRDDFVFSIPWNSMGIWGAMSTVHFIVSDGANGRVENVVNSYYVEKSDLVKIGGKVYFRASDFWERQFEKSKHNHWVYQVFSFDKNGNMKCANAEVGCPFPAVTIFYEDQKFKQIELTAADLEKIAKATEPRTGKYEP